MSANYSIETDLKEAEAMAQGLSDYVRGDQLYGNTGGGFFSRMPSLTIGALVMRLHRLNILDTSMNDSQRQRLEKATALHNQVQREWFAHYEEKLLWEIESRLNSMRAFFRECRENADQCPQLYKPEALKRTIVEELVQTMPDLRIESDSVDKLVKETDGMLRSLITKSDFLWDEALAPIYPMDKYWWLYSSPPEKE
ncbi:hypothetical protein G4Y79_00160 [Phototrophicus methaneseepsis]|uniref:Uncharacterized protein n=1 Tax=Phototrophicus methaneseepsis TaxID=2710758 RepID=A0A7S8E9F5_9CHLR|nr:hypothetical protein [Phototrophicus methaneseepsis]QPC82824.1 hypothetical protein G4Y79_00160 [Phototrophicus methaneseepsis]